MYTDRDDIKKHTMLAKYFRVRVIYSVISHLHTTRIGTPLCFISLWKKIDGLLPTGVLKEKNIRSIE